MARKIVVVAPTFNEEENIKAFILAVLKHKVTILISDSHSTDKTPQIVSTLMSKNFKSRLYYLDVKKRGLGLGLSKGIDYAVDVLKADIVVTMEADLSNDVSKLSEFVKALDGCDMVVGSRYISGGGIKNWSLWRRLLSRAGNLLIRTLSGTHSLHEFTNLYRVFTPKVWKFIRPDLVKIDDWLFVPVFVLQAAAGPFRIKELPYVFLDRFGGTSKMNTPSYTINLFKYAISKRLKKSASFFKFLVVGGVGFIINTTVLVVGVSFGMVPANAGLIGAELAIISNFSWNNLWTFADRKLTSWGEIPKKFLTFNILSFGSAIIQFIFLKTGELMFGLDRYKGPIIDMPIISIISWYMIFYVTGVAVGLVWNYIMYSKVIWKAKKLVGKSS